MSKGEAEIWKDDSAAVAALISTGGPLPDPALAENLQIPVGDVTPYSMIQLLKGILNNTEQTEITLEVGGDLNVVNKEIELRLGDETSAKEQNPDAVSANINSLLRGILAEIQLISVTGVKTLKSTVSAAAFVDIPNNYVGSFIMTKLLLRETLALDNDITLSIGTPASPTLYANAIPVLTTDFIGGVLSLDTFLSYAPVLAAADYRITIAGAATIGQLEPTLIGVIA
jgi:hypothetical protein